MSLNDGQDPQVIEVFGAVQVLALRSLEEAQQLSYLLNESSTH